jgi:L-rhamnose-H+ transport protein
MQYSPGLGLTFVLLAGLCQGSFFAPAKAMRGWAWENYWLIFATTAYLVSPWILALSTIPDLWNVYAGSSLQTLTAVTLFGLGWGIGALTFGLGVEALGLSLGFAIILGTTAIFGALVPLFLQTGAQLSTNRALLTGFSLTVMLAGVTVCSVAGKWKESSSVMPRSYLRGVFICLVSGILSGCGNLGFVFGDEISRRAHMLGAPAYLASNAVWTLLTLPLFFCNAGYSIYLIQRNRTGRLYRKQYAGRYFLLALSMGILWMAGFAFYGAGVHVLGSMGPSLGWAIMMSTVVLVANLLGFLTGEWTAAPASSKRQLAVGLLLLICAVTGLGLSNR